MFDLTNSKDLNKYAAASEKEILAIEDMINFNLPAEYRIFLKYTNGLSSASGVLIYGTEEIIERNETWEVNEYAKGYLAIGDDGGGTVFLMALNAEESKVFSVGSGDMNPQNATIIAADFTRWIDSGCVSETEDEELGDPIDTCNILLTASPNGGLKDLVKIKNVLHIKISASDLLKCSKNLPCELVKDYPYIQAIKLIESMGEIGQALTVVPLTIKE
ncbi:SMI1/KNR4 family protein [Lysinibacillus sp. G4S2]|uniref:SMI1/KNR4 family protein n=1 Tax=Lysinibacillus sp. G4S2 TaxID=3055859 RepID=UPI0025A034C4|nr:SMI1/KNR4 family protein [Lysinibacillus sp. G4S2]MDM5249101.1 SMI1/KNR4 family protein [Lysinibacillus sp. G4S2]